LNDRFTVRLVSESCSHTGQVRSLSVRRLVCSESGHIYILGCIYSTRHLKGGIVAVRLSKIAIMIIASTFLVAQPPPPQLDSKAVERRIGEVRSRLERNAAPTPEQKELMSYVQRYLDEAGKALAAGRRFQAGRLVDAADACRRPVDHLQRIAIANQAKPPGPKSPGDPEDRLRDVYFRLRLSDFFLQQIPSPAPARLLQLARDFYEQAVKARQAGNGFVADEYTGAAADLTHALESLAQAALPDNQP
jgi:hypothetical protein